MNYWFYDDFSRFYSGFSEPPTVGKYLRSKLILGIVSKLFFSFSLRVSKISPPFEMLEGSGRF